MLLIEAGLRGGAVALLVLFAVLLLRDGRHEPAGLYGAFFALSAAGYVITTEPALLLLRTPWLLPVRLPSLGTPAMFWLFAVACFDDEFKPSWRDALPWCGTVILGWLCASGIAVRVCPAYHALQLVFVALAMRQALAGRAADLVERRRRFRIVIVIAAAIYSGAVIVSEMLLGGPPAAPPLSTVNASGLLALIFAILLAQATLSARGLVPPQPAASGGAAAEVPAVSAAPATAAELALLERLRRVMEADKAYREEGLSVASLAARLELPEYRLRRLINQRLGHRNFSAFVNGYRLAEAQAALADPGQSEVPVVTIALDAGFQSLGPFNRAFKAHTGMTPTDYRRLRLARAQ